MPFDGYWPGTRECQEWGWFAKPGPNGWQSCAPDDPNAMGEE